ncbi:MAG: hypothetical protein C5B51_27380 [Terriglobia bacterium]|nr:MAG: hypothetical protein C5B51_27380 [Terriglobia bacterium]
MAHEAFLSFGNGLRQTLAAGIHRLMTIVLLGGADQIWTSTPEVEKRLRSYLFGRRVPFRSLPIPSAIPVLEDPVRVCRVRERYVGQQVLVGHFGTYGESITTMLEPILSGLCNRTPVYSFLLMGRGSESFRQKLIGKAPHCAAWVHATGSLAPDELSHHIAACDILLQPYPEGVNTRRSSLMAGLCHGKPIVTTFGPLTEMVWREGHAVAMAAPGDTNSAMDLMEKLRSDTSERARMGQAAQTLYDSQFAISHTVEKLRGQAR